MNNFGARAQLVRHGVSTREKNEQFPVAYGHGRAECDGHFGFRSGVTKAQRKGWNGLAKDQPQQRAAASASEADGASMEQVKAVESVSLVSFREGFLGTVLDSPGEEFDVVKVDVEGAEAGVVNASLLPLLRARRIRHLIVEANPQWWRGENIKQALVARAVVAGIVSSGYRLHTLRCDEVSSRGKPSPCTDPRRYFERMILWHGHLPPQPEDLHFERV